MGLKVAVVGGGSTYTPELVEGFARRAAVLPIDELVLLDPDPERLEIVGGLAGRILRRAGLARAADADRRPVGGPRRRRVHAHPAARRRPGGAARRRDAAADGSACIGQETTGPGGFAKALRTVPLVLDIAEESARRGAPGVWILDFTNPVGIVTQALLDAGHRALGLCNVAIGFQRGLARALRRRRRTGSRSTTWGSTTCRGSGRSGSTASTGCRSCSTAGDEAVTLGGDFPLEVVRALGRDPVLLPALLLRDRRRPARAARRRQPGDGRHRASSASCSTCTATRRSTASPSCSSGAAAPTTARRRRR